MSRKAIDRAREEITAGWLGGDADAILVHTTDDAMFLAPREPPVVGNSAMRTWLNLFFSQIAMRYASSSESSSSNAASAACFALEYASSGRRLPAP